MSSGTREDFTGPPDPEPCSCEEALGLKEKLETALADRAALVGQAAYYKREYGAALARAEAAERRNKELQAFAKNCLPGGPSNPTFQEWAAVTRYEAVLIDGPDVCDGTDAEGFVGGDERCGVDPTTLKSALRRLKATESRLAEATALLERCKFELPPSSWTTQLLGAVVSFLSATSAQAAEPEPNAVIRACAVLARSYETGCGEAPHHAMLGISPDAARELSHAAKTEHDALTIALRECRKAMELSGHVQHSRDLATALESARASLTECRAEKDELLNGVVKYWVEQHDAVVRDRNAQLDRAVKAELALESARAERDTAWQKGYDEGALDVHRVEAERDTALEKRLEAVQEQARLADGCNAALVRITELEETNQNLRDHCQARIAELELRLKNADDQEDETQDWNSDLQTRIARAVAELEKMAPGDPRRDRALEALR
jgi:hypothetical protein